MSEEREFDVGENTINGRYRHCPVCDEKFKLGEKIVLVPLQLVRKGFGNVVCLPVHSKCRWVDDD